MAIPLMHIVKGYLFDVDALWKKSFEEVIKLRDKRLRKLLRMAYNVPLYHQKFREAGIKPEDIRGVKDLNKIPITTKEDIRKNYPEGIKTGKNLIPLSTSGSTGKPITIFVDDISIANSILSYVRILKAYGRKWNKTKVTIIADTTYGSSGYACFLSKLPSTLMKLLHARNYQIIGVNEKPEIIARKINEFKPDFMNGYPSILRVLAGMKMEGKMEDVNPEYISSSGAVLDRYTRSMIEKAFGAKVFDVYESTEGGPMAFECRKGCYHIHSDMVYIEILDDEFEHVGDGEVGKVVVTRVYGKGTPIIRYDGMGDLAKYIGDSCKCGINSECLGDIEGRKVDAIVTPDGNEIPPFSITGIPNEVMSEHRLYLLKQFQIVQESKNELRVKVIPMEGADKEKLEHIYEEMKKRFMDKLNMNVVIEEVDRVDNYGEILPPLVVSRVSKN